MADTIIIGLYGCALVYMYTLWSHGEGHHRRHRIGGVKICDAKTTNSHAKATVRHGGVHMPVTNKLGTLERIHARQAAHVHRVYGLTVPPGMYHHLPMGLTREEAYRVARYLYSTSYGLSVKWRHTDTTDRDRA